MSPEKTEGSKFKGIWGTIKFAVGIARDFPPLHVEVLKEVWAEKVAMFKLRRQIHQIHQMRAKAFTDILNEVSHNPQLARFARFHTTLDDLYMKEFIIGRPPEVQESILQMLTTQAEADQRKLETTGDKMDRFALERTIQILTRVRHHLQQREN